MFTFRNGFKTKNVKSFIWPGKQNNQRSLTLIDNLYTQKQNKTRSFYVSRLIDLCEISFVSLDFSHKIKGRYYLLP